MSGHIHLTGFMGAGKSTVGRLLASRLERAFVDLDEVVEADAGSSVAEIFAGEGEPAFRERERQALAALDTGRGLVVAVGGGLPVDAGNRALMRSRGPIVWLDAPFSVCWRRIAGSDPGRPLATSRREARALYRERRPAYGDCDLHVQCGARPEAELAAYVADALARRDPD